MRENKTGYSSNLMMVTAAMMSELQYMEQTNNIWKMSNLNSNHSLLPFSPVAFMSYAQSVLY